jgi:hypothetical protein
LVFGAHRLPGIAFEAVPRPAPEALPPMDVALFAGFAAMGPVHRPVALEDYAAFRGVFGDECPLAFDETRGALVTAALAPVVRAFFANGGRRCWVVRLARTAELQALLRSGAEDHVASTGRVKLPGVLALQQDGTTSCPFAQARSLGSWSDGLSVAARVKRRPFVVAGFTLSAPAPTGLARGRREVKLDQLTFSTSTSLTVGDLIEFDDELGTVFAAVESIDGPAVRASLVAKALPSSPPLASPPDCVSFGGRLPLANALASRVTLELRVDQGSDRTFLADIGLTPLHPRSWWTLLSDDVRPLDGPQPTLLIAAEDAELDPDQTPLVWLPLGLTGLFSNPVAASHDGRTSLERDGLSRLDAQLFLDPVLADIGSDRVMEEAERIMHLEGRRLLGIHSVLDISEAGEFNPVSLLAVPDAIQAGWVERELRTAPQPHSESSPPAHWFDHRGPCATVPGDAGDRRDLDRSHFLDCATRIPPAPQFGPVHLVLKPGPLELSWTGAEPDFEFVLDLARSAKFMDAETIYVGPDTSRTISLASEGFYYLRLRARLGDEVSEPAFLALTVTMSDWVTVAPKDFDSAPLLTVQRALLRLASATGEMFALLSFPRHYRIVESAVHARELRSLGGTFGAAGRLGWNERRALSYGALHHPWIVSPASTEGLVAAPPDGAIAGIHARRTQERGAWIAAANEPLRDVVAIDSSMADTDWLRADEELINLVRRDPRGFLLLDSDTLSDELEWRQINVRRLMSLLRRVALRRGTTYVFEPNDEVLRRAVERGFTELLEQLYTLGAFAGRAPGEAYRLAVDTTSQDRDAARLVVEIAVAPAQPLRFLTVRLVQAGGRFAVAGES